MAEPSPGILSAVNQARSEYHRKWYMRNKERVLAKNRKWREINKGKMAFYGRRRRTLEGERLKIYARNVVDNALRRGWIRPKPCEICGGEAEAHHADYAYALEIRWFCKPHHEILHHASP